MEQPHGARRSFSALERLPISDDWFEVYRVTPSLFVFREARHWEETIPSLVVGDERAVLVDTGCGIGDLRRVVERVTELPVTVVNTHTHLDHLGSNRQFDEVLLFDHPWTRRMAAQGVPTEILRREILAEGLVSGPLPEGFDPSSFDLPPFEVARWLEDGDRVDLGDRNLEVIATPGEAPDHVCFLDASDRVLFCGDILLAGPVWTFLEGGSLEDLTASYRKLMERYDEFDRLMPGHNDAWLDKDLLPEALAGAERVAAGEVHPTRIADPWDRPVDRYRVGRFEVWTAVRD